MIIIERLKILDRLKQVFFPGRLKHDQLFSRLNLFLIIINAGHFLMVGFFIQRLPNILVLHSNIYFGIDLIGSWYYITAAPLLGLLISLVHYMLSISIYSYNKTLVFFLLIGALFIQIFLIIGSWFIIHLNV